MARWTVNIGTDVIVVERTAAGAWLIDILGTRPAVASREQVEELRLKLGAALADGGGQ